MQPGWLYADAVLVGERYRGTLGDLEPLMASLERFGQRHPVIVLDNHELLAGERRLAALRTLGVRQVDVHVVRTVADACEALKADAATVTDTPDCLPLTPSERIAQVEPLWALRQREIDRGAFKRGGTPQRGRVYGNEVYVLAAHALGMSDTNYRFIRFAYQLSHGRRPNGKSPVSDLERQLARDALKIIDAGTAGVEATINRLRAQLGYLKRRHLPTLPVDPNRTPADLEPPKPRERATPRKPLPDDVQRVAVGLVKAIEGWQRVTRDDRWADYTRKIPPSVRSTIIESHEWLGKLLDQLPAPTPKDERR